jgi:hypothetical protein
MVCLHQFTRHHAAMGDAVLFSLMTMVVLLLIASQQ